MKFALVDGLRQEAQPQLKGACPVCDHPMVAKCGNIKVHHWAHQGRLTCDHWWENETEWHRGWKNQFPKDWQEFIHRSESGERHIADVKTAEGWSLEFQYSYLKPQERQARDAFYKKLVWVVNGIRRQTDAEQFFADLNKGTPVSAKFVMRRIVSPECRLIREWISSPAPVFFDFGERERIWWLLPKSLEGTREYIGEFPRDQFVHLHRGGSEQIQHFELFLNEFGSLISKYTAHTQSLLRQSNPQGFQQYAFSNRQARAHRRF